MKKISGKVAYKNLEGGVWVLEGDDGQTYQLTGGDKKMIKDGQRIEAEGSVDSGGFSFAMVGPIFKVERYKLK